MTSSVRLLLCAVALLSLSGCATVRTLDAAKPGAPVVYAGIGSAAPSSPPAFFAEDSAISPPQDGDPAIRPKASEPERPNFFLYSVERLYALSLADTRLISPVSVTNPARNSTSLPAVVSLARKRISLPAATTTRPGPTM